MNDNLVKIGGHYDMFPWCICHKGQRRHLTRYHVTN